jgi:regulator of replication initiation timing
MSIKLSVDNLTPSVNKIQRQLGRLSQDAYKVWKDNTPIRTGNARSKTKLSGNTIEANYPYAKRLDEGYSKQSPKGMVAPTEKFIREEIKRILRK